jgi:hypothetical protein
MKLKITLIFLLSVLFSTAIFADEITKETARLVAKNCYFEQTGIKQSEIIFSEELAMYEENILVYYIFNIKDDKGFVIVSADDQYNTIIGYSTEHSYVTENQPENIKSWMETYNKQVKYVIDNDLAPEEKIIQMWEKYNVPENKFIPSNDLKAVEPLVANILWNQSGGMSQGWSDGWNGLCPSNAGVTAVTGCVATAMSIIMYYWKYPIQGNSNNSYYCSPYGTVSANFGNTTYFWNNMEDADPTYFSALLQFHAGVSVEMMYDPEGSGAFSVDVPYALNTYFRYTGSAYASKSSYTNANWINLLKTEINAGRPVYYSGQGEDGGHAFVCSGYDDNDLFHFNWGWGGSENGYFAVTDVNGFNSSNGIVKGITPNPTYYNYNTSAANVNAELDTIVELKVNVEWEAPATNKEKSLTGYDLYRNETIIQDNVSTSTTSYIDTNVPIGPTYYAVRALYSDGTSLCVSDFVDVKNTFDIKFKIKKPNGQILSNSSVTFNGTTQTVNMVGEATFNDVHFGYNQEYTVTHANYPTLNGITDVYLDKSITVTMLVDNIENELIEDINVFPNPSKGSFSINSDVNINYIAILNISGQVILNLGNCKSFDLSNHSDGMYFIQITTDNGTVMQKIIKE